MNKRLFWTLIFSAIFLLGLAMRSPEVLGGNYLFGFDQGQNYIMAYKIAVEHKLTLIGAEVGSGSAGVGGLFHGPGFYYVLALALLLFRGDPFGGLVFMWIGGVLALLLSFLTTRKMFGEKTGLAVMFLVSIAPLIAPQSRFVWGPHLASTIIILYYFALYKIPDRPVFWTFVTILLAGLLYNFELALSVPLVLLGILAVFVYGSANKKVFLSVVLAGLLAFAPMLIFEARHGFMAVRGVATNVFTKKQLSAGDTDAKQGDFYLEQKKYQFIANFRDSFVFESGLVSDKQQMLALAAMSVIILVGILTSGDARVKKYFLILFFAIPISALVFLPLRGAIWPYYLGHLHFVYIYAFAYACVKILEQKRLLSLVVIFFFVSMLLGTKKRMELNWVVDYPDYGGSAKIVGKRAVIDYIYADAKGQPFSVFVFSPPVYTWPYDYLWKTYAKEKFGFLPGSEKKGLVYLIIEQDYSKPWSYKGWLETVIITGDVVWQRHLRPSEVIIQKRMFE